MSRPSTRWMGEAACAQLEEDEAHRLYFTASPDTPDGLEARAICRHRCPVLEECRAYFDLLEPDARDRLFGLVGGEWAGERLSRRRAARAAS